MSQPYKHHPKGPNGTWKTGQRCPEDGYWRDQYGTTSHHERGTTFPPCVGRDGGEAAFRTLIKAAATA